MNHERPRGSGEGDKPRPERETKGDRPHIYVASLADYNAGRLHGGWLDAAQDPNQLSEQIAGLLERSPTPGAEEWAIHDYDGFGPLRLGEYEPIERVAEVAARIAEHGAAFAHWAAIIGSDQPELAAGFSDCYRGHWPSLSDYAQELAADLGYDELLERVIPDSIQAYVQLDLASFARDLELGGDIVTSEGDGGVYVFGPA